MSADSIFCSQCGRGFLIRETYADKEEAEQIPPQKEPEIIDVNNPEIQKWNKDYVKKSTIAMAIIISFIVIIAAILGSGGSKKSKIIGTWDTHGEGDLSFTEDGVFFTYGTARGTWEIEGDELILYYYRGSTDIFTIDELKADTLIVTGGGSGDTQICTRIN